MVELSYFYSGWTLNYIRSLSMHEIDIAREYMISEKKRQQGGEPSGNRRH
jgi:hypothetical protein